MPEPDPNAALEAASDELRANLTDAEDAAYQTAMAMPEPDLTTAVDAGARAWFDRVQAQRRDDGRKRDDGKPWQWEDLTAIDQLSYRNIVLPVVTAVLATTTEEKP